MSLSSFPLTSLPFFGAPAPIPSPGWTSSQRFRYVHTANLTTSMSMSRLVCFFFFFRYLMQLSMIVVSPPISLVFFSSLASFPSSSANLSRLGSSCSPFSGIAPCEPRIRPMRCAA
ncbi:hypothetical protein BDW71DRAFT_187050 [Aspergillus fruticulosus]